MTTLSGDTASDSKLETLTIRFVDYWWVQLPGKLRQYSTVLWAAWSDGFYLIAWPRVATALVVAVFLFGFFEGGTHWSVLSLNGYGLATGFHSASFAQMLPLMVLAVLLGSISANLGLMLVLGFALGDFLWAGVPFSPWDRGLTFPSLYGRIPQIAAYLVFFFLAVWPIVASKFLVASAHRRFRESELRKTVLMVIVQALFVFEWTYFAPMGVKQQWDCCSETSPLDVRYFHGTTVSWLVAAAVIGVIVRELLSVVAEKKGSGVTSHLQAVSLSGASRVDLPPWLRAIIGATIMSLLLLGFTTFADRTVAIFLLLATILLGRVYILPRLRFWQTWMVHIVQWPALLRLAGATVLTYVACRLILMIPGFGAAESSTFGNFGPELGAILIGFVAILVLLPDGSLAAERSESLGDASLRIPVPSGVVQAAIVIALVLLASKRAFASCLDTRCCMNGDNGVASSATAASAPSASSAVPPDGSGASAPEPWWKRWARAIAPKSIPLPGGFHTRTDTPSVGWGGKVDLGKGTSGEVGVDVSPTAGNDPRGPIINVDVNAKVKGPGGVEVGVKDHATVGVNTNNPGVDGTSPHFNDQLDDPAMNQNNEGN